MVWCDDGLGTGTGYYAAECIDDEDDYDIYDDADDFAGMEWCDDGLGTGTGYYAVECVDDEVDYETYDADTFEEDYDITLVKTTKKDDGFEDMVWCDDGLGTGTG